jgi:hypothetical protein
MDIAGRAHNNRSTVIGGNRMRWPVAWYTAFAMAADTPPISAIPLIPMGLTVSHALRHPAASPGH